MTDSDFSFGGLKISKGTKRLYVTATLVPTSNDPRIQPTGFPDIASGVTSKPTIEGHFKTDQWTSPRTRICFTPPTAVLATAVLIYSSPLRKRRQIGMLGGVIRLQNLVPIVAFLRRKVSLENQVRPSPLGSNVCHRQAEHIHQQSPSFIGIECSHNFGSLRQLGDGRLDQTLLLEIRFASQAGILGLVLGIREQRGVRQRVNGAFGQDQAPVIRSTMREPQALFTPSGKAGKSLVLDLVSAQARSVEMRKHCIAAAVDPHPAGKPWR